MRSDKTYTTKEVARGRWAVYTNGDFEGVFQSEKAANDHIAKLKRWDDGPRMPFPSSLAMRKYLY